MLYYKSIKNLQLDKVRKMFQLIWPGNIRIVHSLERFFLWESPTHSWVWYYIQNDGGDKVGFTGYYLSEKTPDSAGLTWTGILPQYRRLGYFTQAIEDIAEIVENRHPRITQITELIPKHRVDDLLPIFQSVGFEKIEDKFGERDAGYQGDDYFVDATLVRLKLKTI